MDYTLRSCINNSNLYKDIIGFSEIKNDIFNIFAKYYIDNDVIIYFEYSDNEGRIIITPKDNNEKKQRSTCKIFNDFPFYNMTIDFIL